MIVLPCATFTADLPDDHIENEDGTEIVQFGGKSVAEAIGEILTGLGYAVDPPRYAHEHGWELDFKVGKRRLWCQVTLIEGYVLDCDDPSMISRLLGRPHPVFAEVLTRLARELGRDPRFHDVLWFRREDVLSDAPGSTDPVSAD